MNNLDLHEKLLSIHKEFQHRFTVAESQMDNWDENLILRGTVLRSLLELLRNNEIPCSSKDELLNILYILQNINPHTADNFDRLISASVENGELSL